MKEKSSSPKFSILSLLLAVTAIAFGLAWFNSQRYLNRVRKDLADAEKLQNYLRCESGYFEIEDSSKYYIRELESQVPLVANFRLSFPRGRYYIVAGDFNGGEFKPENVREALSLPGFP
jgi:hypothetical protein